MADNNFSIPEFLKSAEVFADETDGDLSDDFQNAAIPIIGEMENIMLQYGKESVSNLLPLIVQVFIHFIVKLKFKTCARYAC